MSNIDTIEITVIDNLDSHTNENYVICFVYFYILHILYKKKENNLWAAPFLNWKMVAKISNRWDKLSGQLWYGT